jgi:hypothetical protein
MPTAKPAQSWVLHTTLGQLDDKVCSTLRIGVDMIALGANSPAHG